MCPTQSVNTTIYVSFKILKRFASLECHVIKDHGVNVLVVLGSFGAFHNLRILAPTGVSPKTAINCIWYPAPEK